MIISTSNLRKEYDSVVAVNSVNLQINEGEIYALIGPNGAGKTTLMRMICGLLEPTSGTILVNGVDVWKQNLDANAYMAFLPDFFSLYEGLTVEEYLEYFCVAYKLPQDSISERITCVLTLVNLLEKRKSLTRDLSRGMQQRVGIAKSILHAPKLLVLDEPAAGLDPNARQDLSALLNTLRKSGVTVLVSSHILSELADFSTMVGIMEHGNLVRSGKIKEVLVSENIAQRIIVEFVGLAAELRDFLRKQKLVANSAESSKSRIEFDFNGSDQELVKLHKALMVKDFTITGFMKKEQGIADIFEKVTRENK